ncbi:hypothetical protein OC861_006353, partial [Tilletia horrida]
NLKSPIALNADPSARKLVLRRKRRALAAQKTRTVTKKSKTHRKSTPKIRGSLHSAARRNIFILSESFLASDDEASSDEDDGEDKRRFLKGLVDDKVRYEKGAKRRNARSELTSHMRSLNLAGHNRPQDWATREALAFFTPTATMTHREDRRSKISAERIAYEIKHGLREEPRP